MTQIKTLCPLAERALAVAGCAQLLAEGGHSIFAISIKETDAVITIAYSPKNKQLRGQACGVTYHKGAKYFIYQKDIAGVLVKWLEPYFDPQATAKQVY